MGKLSPQEGPHSSMTRFLGDPHMYGGGPINIGLGGPYNHINIGAGVPKII